MHLQRQILDDYTSLLTHLMIATDSRPSIILSPDHYPWQKELNPFSDKHQGRLAMYVVVFNSWWDLILHVLTWPAIHLNFFYYQLTHCTISLAVLHYTHCVNDGWKDIVSLRLEVEWISLMR